MPNESIPIGNVLKSWEMPEFIAHDRGRWWYFIAGVLAAILLVYAIVKTNYLFAIIILIFAIIIILSGLRKPEPIAVQITETGILLGEHFYPYRDINCFHIVYQPPMVKCLYFETKSSLRPRVTLHLENENPVEIRNLLAEHIKEDHEQLDEPFSEFIGRILKL